jgi:signal transduction histidine kinase
MHVLPQQINHRSILWVLMAGFTLVILLLLTAGFVGITSIRSIQQNAATLVERQQEATDLIDEIQSEQEALSAVFYRMAREPELLDRTNVLAELDQADQNISDIVSQTEGTPEAGMGNDLKKATEGFTAEARHLLAQKNASTLLSRDLFRRHRQVAEAVAKLLTSGRRQSQAAQQMITAQSKNLFTRSFLLLGGCLMLALVFSIATVRMTTTLFRKMEWQTSELSRVSWHMLENQETAARRFSHELHDELGQSLTAVKANIASLGRPENSERRLHDCMDLIDGAIRNVRELSQLLRPTILDDFGLDASLRWLSEKFMQRTGIEVDYSSDFSGRLPGETETHLFRIAQEALTNVARHSRARRVQINLSASQTQVRLSIADNGVGLTGGNGATEQGLGMIGMRARARSADGELVIRSQPGGGLSIEVQVPKRTPEHEQENASTARG